MSKKSHKYVVSPQFALEWRDIYDFLAEFGPFQGRYAAKLPEGWINDLRLRLDELPILPVEKHALKEKIVKKLVHCISSPRSSLTWDANKGWNSNIESNLQNFNDAIVIGDGCDPGPFDNWPQGLEEIRKIDEKSWHYVGTVNNYLDKCRPLIENARGSVYLVDRYFDPFSENTKKLLIELFSLVNKSTCFCVEIITRQSACGRGEDAERRPRLPLETIKSGLKKIYLDDGRIPKDRTLKVHLVTDAGKQDADNLRMHNRFFLTKHGGIDFGKGFNLVYKGKKQQLAHVVGRAAMEDLKEMYINGVSRFSEGLKKDPNIAYPKDVFTITLN